VIDLGVGTVTAGRVYEYSRPPGNLEGIRAYYLERGYTEDPLEMKEEGQIASFAKPIPGETGQSRHHIRIKKTRKYYLIDAHVDNYDPEQSQLGHLRDIISSPEHSITRVRKTENN